MPEESSRIGFRVGLTVVLSLVALGVVLFLTGNYHLTEEGYKISVMFNYARGIEVGAPVLVSGVKLGVVDDVDFIYQENRSRVKLTMWIQKKGAIKNDAKIYIKSLGLLGQSAVEIITGSEHADPVEPGATLEGEAPFVAEEVLAEAKSVAEGLSKTVALFNSILEDAGAKENIRVTIKNLASASSEFERTIRDNAVRIEAIARSVEKASSDVAAFTGKNSKELETSIEDLRVSSSELKLFLQKSRPKAEDIISRTAESVATLEKAAKDIRAVTEKLNAGKSAAGVVLADENAAKGIRVILKNLEDLSQDVRDHPWKLLRKP